jgi:hypothetical protein
MHTIRDLADHVQASWNEHQASYITGKGVYGLSLRDAIARNVPGDLQTPVTLMLMYPSDALEWAQGVLAK